MAILALAVASCVLIAAAVQLALPRLIERHAAKRLTLKGGHARVHLTAFPATRLLRKRGSSLTVKASGLVTRAAAARGTGGPGLEALDGFDRVDIQVIGVHVGPLAIARVNLARARPHDPYEARLEATVTAARIPLDVSATLTTQGGRIATTNVRGSLAGLPAGLLIEALAAAIASSV